MNIVCMCVEKMIIFFFNGTREKILFFKLPLYGFLKEVCVWWCGEEKILEMKLSLLFVF